MKKIKKQTKVMVQMCEHCFGENDSSKQIKEKIATKQCTFCGKNICESCAKTLGYSYGKVYSHFCPECKQFLETTKGKDLKAMGFECEYESLTDENSIETAINIIKEEYQLKGVEAVRKFCRDIYKNGQKRIEAKRISEEKERILRAEITQSKNKIYEAEKALENKDYEKIPF